MSQDVVTETQAQIEQSTQTKLLTQFKTQPNITNLIDGCLSQSKVIEDELALLRTARNVDEATGDALEKLGAWVGQDRNGQADDLYRVFIKGRIRINLSRGTAPDIYAVGRALFELDNGLRIQDRPPAAFDFHITEAPPTELTERIGLVAKAKAAGVAMTAVWDTTAHTSMFIVGAVADFPDTDNDTGIGNVAGSIGGEIAGALKL